MSYVTHETLSDSAAIRRHGEAVDRDPSTEDPPTVRHDEGAWNFAPAVERLISASGSTRPTG